MCNCAQARERAVEDVEDVEDVWYIYIYIHIYIYMLLGELLVAVAPIPHFLQTRIIT